MFILLKLRKDLMEFVSMIGEDSLSVKVRIPIQKSVSSKCRKKKENKESKWIKYKQVHRFLSIHDTLFSTFWRKICSFKFANGKRSLHCKMYAWILESHKAIKLTSYLWLDRCIRQLLCWVYLKTIRQNLLKSQLPGTSDMIVTTLLQKKREKHR